MLTAMAVYWLLKVRHRWQAGGKTPTQQCGLGAWIAGAAVCVVVRPPSGLPWAVVALHQALTAQSWAQAIKLIAHGALLGGSIVAAATAVDSAAYGR